MKPFPRIVLISGICLAVCLSGFSQSPIETYSGPEIRDFDVVQNGMSLTMRELKKLVMDIPEAKKELRIAKTNLAFAVIFDVVSAGLLAVSGEPYDPCDCGEIEWEITNWPLFGLGTLASLISVPFYIGHQSHLNEAARLYNEYYQVSTPIPNLKFGLTQHGVGLTFRF